jgi:GNAT superfamily N-acetyltransferase
MVEVRWAERKDAPLVYALVRALVQAERSDPPSPAVFARTWRESFHGRGFRFALAWEGAQLVGCMSLHAHYSTWRGAPVVSLEDFFVLHNSRGKGIGGSMLAFCDGYARSLKAARIELHVRQDNERAQQLYKRSGFIDTQYLYYHKAMPLAEPPATAPAAVADVAGAEPPAPPKRSGAPARRAGARRRR